MKIAVNLEFSRVSDLRCWLERKCDAAGDPDSYYDWLRSFFEDGNSINVHGEEYDYWSCWELY